MFLFGAMEFIVLLLVFAVPAILVIALVLVIRNNQRTSGGHVPMPVPSRIERTSQLRERRDRYQYERLRILGMVDAGTISADEADRLLVTLERETTSMACPLCGGEIRVEAIKCPHCRQFLTDEYRYPRRLTKSHDKLLAGVCAGVADYAGIDPSVVRVLTALVILFSGIVTGLIAYLVAALLLPEPNP